MSEIEKVLRQFVATKPAAGPAQILRSAFTPELRSINNEARTIDFVASTESVDRYGDILRVRGWRLDNYKKNPVFLWAHKSSDPPIGRTLDVHVETSPKPALVHRVEFANEATYPFAATIFNLYKGGFLNSVSVGFRPLEPPVPLVDEATGRMGGMEYTSMELLELSAVPLPANPQAVARALDSGLVTQAEVERCFIGKAATDGNEPATAEDFEALLAGIERLRETVAQRIVQLRSRRGIESIEDLEKLLRV